MTLKEIVHRAIEQKLPINVRMAKVEKVNEDTSCDVSIGKLVLLDVRVCSVIGADLKGIIPEPKVGSSVIIGVLDNKNESAFIILLEELDKLSFLVPEILLSGDEFGGIVKSKIVADEVNANRAEINKLKQALSSWTPIPQDGGASLKTILSSSGSLVQKQPTPKGTFENEKVKHG